MVGICAMIMRMINKIVCLIVGHVPYRINWSNKHHLNMKRKGRHKTGHGILEWKTKHYKVYCERCGKVLKQK